MAQSVFYTFSLSAEHVPCLIHDTIFFFADKQGLDTEMPLSPQWLMKVGENKVRH